MQKGKTAGAVEIFASLLEEARATFGEASIESAPAYYEYGNSLFRDSLSEEENTEEDAAKVDPREAAALAAERRRNGADPDADKKPTAKPSADEVFQETAKEEEEEEEEENDAQLALEMMETAWSIVDQYILTETESKQYLEWAEEQSPRYLIGIGDILMALERYADAADAYSRSLELRGEFLQKFDPKETSLAHLKCRRLIVEALILIAEAFLAAPEGEDMVTTETKAVLVKADERIDYARGYYDKARDEFQETILLMGEMAAKGFDVAEEKEDICFVSTMVMGVGMKLAELDEIAESNSSDPPKKKSKVA